MSETPKLNRPWLVAVWPGMGQVALSGGYYLMAKLGMHLLAEVPADGLFDVDFVDVKAGLIQRGQAPRSRFFVGKDPSERHDLVVFIGEAQPPRGKYRFCETLINYARSLGVERVFTFAAMATSMHPNDHCRVFCAATDDETLKPLRGMGLTLVDDGHIGGLNGVLLGAALERKLPGVCLLGEMPQLFAQVPFPKASLAVLKVFTKMAQIDLDFQELSEQAEAMQEQLGTILDKMEQAYADQRRDEPLTESYAESDEQERLSPDDQKRIETLFQQAAEDRSKAYVLKQELDRLDAFKEYEDRFLDLFRT